ncbi:hypothetical protein [Streptomyces luteogriseus]|uniref:hypothetical protein n=1 Tax=Streptomyces luteogriseus TaxID=68233 RepID=UPI003797E686
MKFIVVKVEETGPDLIADMSTLRISNDISKAATAIGSWKGDIFAIWDWTTGSNSTQEAAAHARAAHPDSAVVVSGGNALLTLHQEHTMSIAIPQ